jgi:hypothetical protein
LAIDDERSRRRSAVEESIASRSWSVRCWVWPWEIGVAPGRWDSEDEEDEAEEDRAGRRCRREGGGGGGEIER